MARRILLWGLGVIVTALYVYVLVSAIGNLVLLPGMAAEMGLGLTGIAWFWLIFGVALPVVVYVVALFLARRRSGGIRVLVLAAAFCVVAAVQLEVLHLVPQSQFFA